MYDLLKSDFKDHPEIMDFVDSIKCKELKNMIQGMSNWQHLNMKKLFLLHHAPLDTIDGHRQDKQFGDFLLNVDKGLRDAGPGEFFVLTSCNHRTLC